MFPVVVPSPRLPLNDLNMKIIPMAMTIMMMMTDDDVVGPLQVQVSLFSFAG